MMGGQGYPGCPGNPGILSIKRSRVCNVSSQVLLGIPGYFVLRGLGDGSSQALLGIPGYFILRDVESP